VAGQPVVLRLRVRRVFCRSKNCPAATFAEQVGDLTTKDAHRTSLCRSVLEHTGLALPGRAGSRPAAELGFVASRGTLLGLVHALPDPEIGTVTVLGVDDFAIARGRKYATVLIDAITHRRIDELPDRKAATLAAWLREHPGVEVVCRDGSAAYAEAIRQAAPQASDPLASVAHLASAVEKTVIAHSTCWNTTPSPADSTLAARTRERFTAVHDLSRGPDPVLQQRAHRRRQHEDQAAQATDLRQSQLQPATQKNPPHRLTVPSERRPSLITQSWTEPLV
jgi:hypothetical protein